MLEYQLQIKLDLIFVGCLRINLPSAVQAALDFSVEANATRASKSLQIAASSNLHRGCKCHSFGKGVMVEKMQLVGYPFVWIILQFIPWTTCHFSILTLHPQSDIYIDNHRYDLLYIMIHLKNPTTR